MGGPEVITEPDWYSSPFPLPPPPTPLPFSHENDKRSQKWEVHLMDFFGTKKLIFFKPRGFFFFFPKDLWQTEAKLLPDLMKGILCKRGVIYTSFN